MLAVALVPLAAGPEDGIPSVWNLSLLGGLVGLLVFISISVMRGWFIPARTHERELAQERLRADEWKAVADERKKTINSLIVQNTAMLEATKTTVSVVQSLPVAAPESES